MLTSLRLRAGLITSNQKQSGVHNCSSSEHSSHEHIMAWAINEGNVPDQLEDWITASWSALRVVFFLGSKRLKALGGGASGALVQFWVGVAQLDSNISESLLVMTDSVDSWDGPDQCGLSVGDMADRSYIDSRLSRYDFGRQGSERLDVERGQVLVGQMLLRF